MKTSEGSWTEEEVLGICQELGLELGPDKVKIVIQNRRKKPVFYQYQGQCFPQRAYLEIDPTKCTKGLICHADYSGEIGNGVPMDVWHNRIFRIPVSPEVSRKGLKALETDAKFVALVDQLVDSWEEVWNGNNYVGRFDSDAYHSLCWHVWETTMNAWEHD
jgi:hypothetical protein